MADPSTEDPKKGTDNDAVDTSAEDSSNESGVDIAKSKDAAPDEPEVHHDEPVETVAASDIDHHDEPQGSSFAATALKYLVIALVLFAGAIWALPRIVPSLPEGMAKTLMPAQIATDERLSSLEAQVAEVAQGSTDEDVAALEAQIADLVARLEAAEQEAAAARTAAEEAAQSAANAATAEDVVAEAGTSSARAASAAETATEAATEAGRVATTALRDTSALARRMTGIEAQVAAVSEELSTLGTSMAGSTGAAGTEGGSQEAAAAYAALKTRLDDLAEQLSTAGFITSADAENFVTVEDLRSTRTALTANLEAALAQMPPGEEVVSTTALGQAVGAVTETVSALTSRIDTVEQTAASAEAAASAARDQVASAITTASLKATATTMLSQLASGQPFAATLAEVATLSGTAAPDALSAVAATGVMTAEQLSDAFARPYQDAVAADIREQSDGGVFGNATARLRAVASGRPVDAVDGDTVDAVLSRVAAALASGDPAAALGETEALSDPVKAALGGWLETLSARVAADTAAANYTAGLGVNEG